MLPVLLCEVNYDDVEMSADYLRVLQKGVKENRCNQKYQTNR
jgi:hypothetical protein